MDSSLPPLTVQDMTHLDEQDQQLSSQYLISDLLQGVGMTQVHSEQHFAINNIHQTELLDNADSCRSPNTQQEQQLQGHGHGEQHGQGQGHEQVTIIRNLLS